MPGSRKTLAVILPLLLAATFILVLPAPRKAQAEIWKWRQTDWSGGYGQAAWGDPTKFDIGDYADAMGTPGSLKLAYVYSAFTKQAGNPVIPVGAAGTWDAAGAAALAPLPLGAGYQVFYLGDDAGGILRTGYATSPNGVAWTKATQNPVLGTGTWNPNGSWPGPLVIENDTYREWFAGLAPGTVPGYGYAESTDAVNWSLSPLNPVFQPGTAGSWDEKTPLMQVLLHEGNLFKMWYTAANAANLGQVGYATSVDGRVWSSRRPTRSWRREARRGLGSERHHRPQDRAHCRRIRDGLYRQERRQPTPDRDRQLARWNNLDQTRRQSAHPPGRSW
jgi:hypothetical protein